VPQRHTGKAVNSKGGDVRLNIRIIFTGGTIGSVRRESGIGTEESAVRELLALYREQSGDRTDFHTAEPYRILSENLTLSHLKSLADSIRQESAHADALIVTHGTDTLPYTATALSYILGLCRVPVVLVSSNYILSDPRANGVTNLRAAIDFLRATPDARGVYVSYRNSGSPCVIHRASRLFSHLSPTDEVYSLDGAVALWQQGALTPLCHTEKADAILPLSPEGLCSAEQRVLFLRAHPGMQLPVADSRTAAVLIETYHSGTLPTAWAPLAAFAHRTRAAGIPVFLVGITGEATYESAAPFGELGLTPLPRMSPIAAYMKLALTVGAGLDPYEILPLPLGGDMA